MKQCKLFLLGIFALIAALPTWAGDLTPAQKQYLDAVATFLRQEGFSPSYDEDNSLTFKKEGVLYWFDIQDDGPFFISFHRAGLGAANCDMYAIYRAINDVNTNRKGVKAFYNDGSVILSAEMFLQSANELKRVFYQNIKQLDIAYEEAKEQYAKYDPS